MAKWSQVMPLDVRKAVVSYFGHMDFFRVALVTCAINISLVSIKLRYQKSDEK